MGQKLLGMGGLTVAVLIGAVVVAGGSARSEDGAQVTDDDDPLGSEQQLLAQSRELDEALDDLEVRLFAGRTTVRLWSELASRHRHVSELACGSNDKHMEAMVSLDQRNRGRAAARKLAAVRPGETRGTGYLAPGAAPVSSTSTGSKLVP